MLSVAIALNHLHSKNIAHLDIKSPNILLTSHGEAKVADVGLSTMIQQGLSIVSRTSTFAWSAPEQLHGHAGKPADIWAFGTVLWEVSPACPDHCTLSEQSSLTLFPFL